MTAWKKGLVRLAWLLLGGVGCTALPTLPVTPTPSPTATALPTATPTLTPTPTPTPFPTPDPALAQATAMAGQAQIQALAGTATVVCFRYEDTDGDTAPEWIALLHQAGPPARLSAFVLDGPTAFPLEAALPDVGKPDYGLGQYATCELEVRDVNADGKPETAIFGHAENAKTLLHLFVWDAALNGYRRLGDFMGDAGVRLENRDGDLADEIVVGYREQHAQDLAWYTLFTWDGQTYGWTADRYGWYFLDRPHVYPTHKPEFAVIAFYLALNDRDLPGAYGLLAPSAQAQRAYTEWAAGFHTTLRVEVGSVHTVPTATTDTQARVAAMVTSWDNETGHIIARLWNVEWDTVLTSEGWRLVSGTTAQLDQWEARYWP